MARTNPEGKKPALLLLGTGASADAGLPPSRAITEHLQRLTHHTSWPREPASKERSVLSNRRLPATNAYPPLTWIPKQSLAPSRVERVKGLERKLGRIIPYVFPHLRGRRAGDPRHDFRRAWQNACKKAGVPGMLRHDFRRTAVRDMVNAGVPERVAMTVTGHKTRAVFDRYHIVSPGDLQDVARKLTGTISGTMASSSLDSRALTR